MTPTPTQFWQSAAWRSLLAAVVVPVVVYALGALAAAWTHAGNFAIDYDPVLIGAAALAASLFSSWLTTFTYPKFSGLLFGLKRQ